MHSVNCYRAFRKLNKKTYFCRGYCHRSFLKTLFMRQHIPNLITLLNLACGFSGILAMAAGQPVWTVYFVGLAAVFDFFDGLAARLLKAHHDIGKDLDSLADLVSFGVVPALLVSMVLSGGRIPLAVNGKEQALAWLVTASPVLLVLASAIRLARFNHDGRQTRSFLGLPTPASGLFFTSYVFLIIRFPENTMVQFMQQTAPLLLLVFLFSFLMVSSIPMFSLKFPHLKFRGNEIRFLFVGISAILLILLQWFALPLFIGWYILLSLFAAGFRPSKD